MFSVEKIVLPPLLVAGYSSNFQLAFALWYIKIKFFNDLKELKLKKCKV